MRSSSSSNRSLALIAPAFAGVLSVDVLGAQNLPPAVLSSLLKWTPSYANPYVVLSLDRERFVSSIKHHDLNPSWKEIGKLNVPLPSETEVLQTVGGPDGHSANAVGKSRGTLKAKGGTVRVTKPSAAAAAAAAALGYRQFHPCAPELYVQVFHSDATNDTAVASSSASTFGRSDKLIGAVIVPLLPCLLSASSSSRGWYQLTDEEAHDAGRLQLALTFDASAASNGLEPKKGDIVRLAGFGGLEYYAKILSPSARMEVLNVIQDQVIVQTESQEGWVLRFELHRNLLHVERRPSLLHDASAQLQTHVSRVRQLRVVTSAQHVWLAIPNTPRIQVETSVAFVSFFGAHAYATLRRGIHDLFRVGVMSGVQTMVEGSKDAFEQVKQEFLRVYWSTPRRVTRDGGGYNDDLVDCGPHMNRGHIVQAFTAADRIPRSEEAAAQALMMHWDTYEESDTMYESADEVSDEGVVPEQLICPITGCPMVDPVVAADGHSYERDAIIHWLLTSDISPMTGMHMATTQVFPNFTLRQLSEEVQAATTRRQQATRRQRPSIGASARKEELAKKVAKSK